MGGKYLTRSRVDSKSRHYRVQKNRAKAKHQQVSRNQQQQQQQLSENLSFSGCGFMGIYHVGVASCFHEYAPQLSMHKIAGSSAGALVAVAHICGNVQLLDALSGIIKVAIEARSCSLIGPLHPSFDINKIVRDALEEGLPNDVHSKVSGKLHISLTRADDWENVIVSKFESKEDVIQALICSCFIPIYSGFTPPKYKGVKYVDGGLSDNLLRLDEKTVTVSPFAGEADICPQDDAHNLLSLNLSNTSVSITPHNLSRIQNAFYPLPPQALIALFEQGFRDGARFLQRMELVSCPDCIDKWLSDRIRTSLLGTGESDLIGQTFSYQSQRRDSTSSYDEHLLVDTNSINFDDSMDLIDWDDCDGCVTRRKNVLREPLPEKFVHTIREACDAVNKSLYNWFYSHRPIKYLSYLAAPYYLPMNISLALCLKYLPQLPAIGIELVRCVSDLKDILAEIAKKVYDKSITSMLMSSILESFEQQEAKQRTAESSISLKITADCRGISMRSLTTYQCCLTIVLLGRQNLLSIQK